MYVTPSKPSKHAAGKARSTKSTKTIRLKFIVITEQDGDSYHAFCPAFKGLHADGTTEKKAVRNAANAAAVYIESLIAHGEPLPLGPYCSVPEEEQIPTVPRGALLHYLELQWPSLSMSGIS
jgi:predicted RNase H-like HicB family nuclease